jgi:dienelactone hydrolase
VEKLELSHSFRHYLDELYARRSREWAFRGQGAAEFRRWQEQTRPRLAALLGGRERHRCPLNLRRALVEETATYRRERLYYDTRPNLTATAQLLLPKAASGPVPAVLCPPGHGGGMNQVLDEPGAYKQYPFALVARGLAALVPEHIGFGERTGAPDDDRQANHAFFYHALVLLGENAMGYLVWDLQRALDVLQSLPEVDGDRLGCYGLSLGGEMTLLLAACDPRVKVAGISGFLTSYQHTFLAEGHCGCGYVPQLARRLEHQDIAALIVPRPLVVETGTEDPSFPTATARASVEYLRSLYALEGAEDRLALDVFAGGHEISGAIAYDWFPRFL